MGADLPGLGESRASSCCLISTTADVLWSLTFVGPKLSQRISDASPVCSAQRFASCSRSGLSVQCRGNNLALRRSSPEARTPVVLATERFGAPQTVQVS